MPNDRVVTHEGLPVFVRKYDHENSPEAGAGLYELYVELDGVPVVFHTRKAGTIDRRRAALKALLAEKAADKAESDTPAE